MNFFLLFTSLWTENWTSADVLTFFFFCSLTFSFALHLTLGGKHMELAEWLVYWAPKLASRVRCSTRSSL